jgi:hypothetical protein
MKRHVGIILIVLFLSSFSRQEKDDSFNNFWSSFQTAIISQDYKALAAKTNFPLKAKGVLDYDTTDKYPKKDFERIFSKFLNSIISSDSTTRLNVLSNYKLSGDQNEKYGSVRIDNMIFERVNGKWKLTLIYDGHSKY